MQHGSGDSNPASPQGRHFQRRCPAPLQPALPIFRVWSHHYPGSCPYQASHPVPRVPFRAQGPISDRWKTPHFAFSAPKISQL